MGRPDLAAKIAEERLGMSSLGLHGAAEVPKYMPQGMQDAGTSMHHAASRFAIIAQDTGVTGDLKQVFAGLAEITAQCVGCHAGYRLK
jgi:cytochrome c556